MRVSWLASLILVGSLLSPSAWSARGVPAAPAAQATALEDTGIAAFDAVYGKARGMVRSVDTVRTRVDEATGKVTTVLGLPRTTPIAGALASLKAKAPGKIKVAMNGRTPTLTATESVPQDVKDGMDAVNALLVVCTSGITSIATVPEAARALGVETAAFPGRVAAESRTAGLGAAEVRAAPGRVTRNAALVAEIPASASGLVTALQNVVSSVISVFSS